MKRGVFTSAAVHRLRRGWLIPALACALFISGCAVYLGVPFKADEVKKLSVGTTTQAQVVESFGEPASKGLKDGRPLWTYLFVRVPLTGGTAKGTLLSIEFDDRGLVSSYSYVPY
jgi:outer membrane protein assembly factor BamE (lipoprotein component of BamABCDE complex)